VKRNKHKSPLQEDVSPIYYSGYTCWEIPQYLIFLLFYMVKKHSNDILGSTMHQKRLMAELPDHLEELTRNAPNKVNKVSRHTMLKKATGNG